MGQDIDIKATLTLSLFKAWRQPGLSCPLNMGVLPREAQRHPKDPELNEAFGRTLDRPRSITRPPSLVTSLDSPPVLESLQEGTQSTKTSTSRCTSPAQVSVKRQPHPRISCSQDNGYRPQRSRKTHCLGPTKDGNCPLNSESSGLPADGLFPTWLWLKDP